jgi:hypothetical protein
MRSSHSFRPNETKRLAAEATRVLLRDKEKPEAERDQLRASYFGETMATHPLGTNSVGKFLCSKVFTDAALWRRAHEEASVSATRLLIAIRCYKSDSGSLPPSLEALAPKYIDELPRDPFDGKALRYSPERKIVYSVGTDLEDAGRSEAEKGWSDEKVPTYPIGF